VYVLSLEGDLYSFAPAQKQFTKVGPLKCMGLPFQTLSPLSMAVDRKAVAWVNMVDTSAEFPSSSIFKVDTTTGACTPTQLMGNIGGMGFSTNAGTTDQETLFVVGQGSNPRTAGLVKVDVVSERFLPGPDLAVAQIELTGTGDGRLYAFNTSPMGVAEVDKSTAKFSHNFPLPTVETWTPRTCRTSVSTSSAPASRPAHRRRLRNRRCGPAQAAAGGGAGAATGGGGRGGGAENRSYGSHSAHSRPAATGTMGRASK
jgi:hypothetical protein